MIRRGEPGMTALHVHISHDKPTVTSFDGIKYSGGLLPSDPLDHPSYRNKTEWQVISVTICEK